jgi:hypothetical protein
MKFKMKVKYYLKVIFKYTINFVYIQRTVESASA